MPVEVNTLYTLYALEFLIMSSVLYARSIQHAGEKQAQQKLEASREQSMHDIEQRKKT